MKICVFGAKTNTRALLDFLSQRIPHEICLVTLAKSKDHFNAISGYDEGLASFCAANKINIHQVQKYNLTQQTDLAFFQAEKFDVGLSMGWQRLIPENILATFKSGVFGWHGSLFKFPNGRGRSPLNWSIRLGADKIFLNFFKYADGVDNGPVFLTTDVGISCDDYIADLQAKVFEVSAHSALKLIRAIEVDQLNLQNQPPGDGIVFPKLSEASGQLSLTTMEVQQALNIVRSCSHPFPGAYVTDIDNSFKLRIWRGFMEAKSIDFGPTRNIIFEDGSFFLKFTDGYLRVTEHDVLHAGTELPSLLI